MSVHRIEIDEDKKCLRCGKGGAVNGNYCMACILKNLKEGKYDHILKKHKRDM